MKQPSPKQLAWGCAGVALLAIASVVKFYSDTQSLIESGLDIYKVGDQVPRFQALLPQIPETAIVGYVSDLPTTDRVGAAMYFGAQYAFAPRLVTVARVMPAPRWTIGDFSKPLDIVQFGSEHGLVLVKDFGNGAVLYSRRGP
jgi:hypothetical protein